MPSIKASVFPILLIFIVSCTAQEQIIEESEPVNAVDSTTEIERPLPYPLDIPNAFKSALREGTRSDNGHPGEDYWQNESSYQLTAELDTQSHTLHGQAEIMYYNNSPDDLDVITLELSQNLHKEGTPKKESTEITGGKRLSKVAVNGAEVEELQMMPHWRQETNGYVVEGTRLYLFTEEPTASGDSVSMEFEWLFEIPNQGASGRMGRSRDNLYMLAYWYPKVAVYDDVYGWLDDPFLGNAEFYHGFADYDVTVSAPAGWIVMGTGEFLNPEETLSGQTLERYNSAGESDEVITIVDFHELENATAVPGDSIVTWRFRSEQVRDVAFSAMRESKWDAARAPVGDLNDNGQTEYTRLNTFYREAAPLWSEVTDYAQHSITFLSEYTDIDYPWPHMTSVEGADIIGGGMEFPMITLMGDYNNAGAVSLYGVTAHEFAHMWIPMIVSTNERRYTWVDEGHTTFHTQKANVDRYGEDRFPRSNLFGQYLQIAGSDYEGEMMRWSDFHYPGPAYGVASYPKPASVLTALEGILGTEHFLEAHREFMDRWKYKHPYPWDFFNTFEDVTGKDLSWFWRSWYYETWVLDQAVEEVSVDGGETTIQIRDKGNIPMPVFLQITTENGTVIEEKIDVDKWLEGTREIEFTIETESPVNSVEIDPDIYFPDVNRSNNSWDQ